MRAAFTRRRGRAGRLRDALGRRRGPRAAPAPAGGAVAARIDDTVEALALLGGRARHLRRPAPRARALQLARAQGPDLPPDRRDRRRADHLAARDGRRRAQLGLPLLVDPRLEPHARGALHRRLLRRGRGVRLVHDQRGRRPRRRATRCRSCTGSAASTTSPSASSPHLRGWRDSRPVRVGNGAWNQVQLDVYGELLNALHLYREQLGELHPEIQPFVADLADTAARRWRETRLGHVGDARRAAPPPLLEGPVLDGARPRRRARAAARRATPSVEAWARGARRDPRGDPRARLEREAAGLRAVVRLRRARRARSC